MKRFTFSNAVLKSILLTDHYPDGNVGYLMGATRLTCGVLDDDAVLDTNLPGDHWAFTCQEEPLPRYRLCENNEDVFDSETNTTVGYFHNRGDAEDYAKFRNDRLKA
jgi:hypothetical protein